jgi:hypothetical protein
MVPGMTGQQTAVLGYSVLVLQECFLKAQHSLGKILYFDQHGLEKFIIVQPQSMVNILRSFITYEHFWPDDESLRDILRAMISVLVLQECLGQPGLVL